MGSAVTQSLVTDIQNGCVRDDETEVDKLGVEFLVENGWYLCSEVIYFVCVLVCAMLFCL